jgi:MazG family protein
VGTLVLVVLDAGSPDPFGLVRSLVDAGASVVVRSGDPAAAALGSAGVAHATLEERGLDPGAPIADAAALLLELSAESDVLLVTGGGEPAATGTAAAAATAEALRAARASGFAELVRTISILRGPGGCPWDLEQTHMSLRPNVIEEAYEVVGAIEAADDMSLAEELGDLMLQIVFHAQMGSEDATFDVEDVCWGIVTKLRRRHPHIFGETQVSGPAEVMRNWDEIKREEKPEGAGILDTVPAGLPSLMRAQKISRRAAGVGFDWETVDQVWDKVSEEIQELRDAREGTREVEEEVGDVLFAIVNVARKLGVDAEVALRETCDKFQNRFAGMEEAADASGRGLSEMGIDELEELWQRAKGSAAAGT